MIHMEIFDILAKNVINKTYFKTIRTQKREKNGRHIYKTDKVLGST